MILEPQQLIQPGTVRIDFTSLIEMTPARIFYSYHKLAGIEALSVFPGSFRHASAVQTEVCQRRESGSHFDKPFYVIVEELLPLFLEQVHSCRNGSHKDIGGT